MPCVVLHLQVRPVVFLPPVAMGVCASTFRILWYETEMAIPTSNGISLVTSKSK
uniref:Uncharacterized protein n=1 Tax=Hyaloperonospora arabidopsidis (strain Emoy2) TaxID=559515 RepID=M4BW72_HYAAE